ncbi:MAG: hypothetical protein HYR94_12535 [Chloroflexi bacterium]|nr:hypothetical protein [Chloroflexota bacterium]
MSSMTAMPSTAKEGQETLAFEKFAGLSGILAAVFHFLYAVAFVVISRSNPGLGGLLSALFLLLAGLLSMTALTGLYHRLRQTEAAFALYALLLTTVCALGAAIHGGYDLANTINPPNVPDMNLPSQIDPRGLLTFGIMGLALFVIAWLIGQGQEFPKGLSAIMAGLGVGFCGQSGLVSVVGVGAVAEKVEAGP